MSFFSELKRRNVFRVGIAYVVIGWLLAQVAEFAFENFDAPDWVLKVFVVLILLGLPVVLLFAWAFELTPEGVKREKDVDRSESIANDTGKKLNYITVVAVVILVGVVLGDRFTSSGAGSITASPAPASASTAAPAQESVPVDKSIAVLPFVSMTSVPDDELFADGLSEELLNVLAKMQGLKVAGRTSAFYYKGRNEDLRTIADALGVAHILEGSVRRSGDKIRVTAQLIKADDGFHLWSETYDRPDGDIFQIQDEISGSVARALQAEILGAPAPSPVTDGGNAEAQNMYFIAQAAIAQRTLPDTRRARDLYAQASVLDPGNPKYLAGYASAVALQYWNFRDIGPDEALAEASGAIEKALALGDPSADTLAVAGLVEELRVLATGDMYAKDKALDFYERAVAKDPDNVLALQWLASIYLDINEPARAREIFERVVELDPLNTLALTGLANAYFQLGMIESARLHLFRIQSLFPQLGMAYRYLSGQEYATGRLDKSTYWMSQAIAVDPNPLEVYMTLGSYIAFGWADEALNTAEQYRQVSDGTDISRLVQARLDRDFLTVAEEAERVFDATGTSEFATLSAWANALAERCEKTVTTLERQYPSLKGEIISYLDAPDLIDAALLAHCQAALGEHDESDRLSRLLLDSEVLSDDALKSRPGLALVRVALHAIAGNSVAAVAELETMDASEMPLAISTLALPVQELPVFEALREESAFKKYAEQERYQIAQQARALATGETYREVKAQVEAAGYALSEPTAAL